MARILLGWELGAGRGHQQKLAAIAAELGRRGHEPILAMSLLRGAPAGYPLFQAPLWPAQLSSLARAAKEPPATMGDILVHLGLVEDGALLALLRGWDAILAAARPALVLAEYAPALVMACRARWPTIALGTGFSLPPSHLDRFPSLTGKPPLHDEGAVLARIAAGLAAAGRPPVARYPELFACERDLPAAFRELDPYADLRRSPAGVPSTTRVAMPDEPGSELFAYVSSGIHLPDLWREIADAGMPVRLHDPRRAPAEIAELERWGIAFERTPVPYQKIALRSRMVLSYGSLGFSCAALLAGLPQFVLPIDIEKGMIAGALVELGVGRAPAQPAGPASTIAAMVAAAFRDDTLLARARALAPGFQARMTSDAATEAADAAEAMLAVL